MAQGLKLRSVSQFDGADWGVLGEAGLAHLSQRLQGLMLHVLVPRQTWSGRTVESRSGKCRHPGPERRSPQTSPLLSTAVCSLQGRTIHHLRRAWYKVWEHQRLVGFQTVVLRLKVGEGKYTFPHQRSIEKLMDFPFQDGQGKIFGIFWWKVVQKKEGSFVKIFRPFPRERGFPRKRYYIGALDFFESFPLFFLSL